MDTSALRQVIGCRIRVATSDGRVRVGWCQGLSARDTRLVLDRVTFKYLIRVRDIVSIERSRPAPTIGAMAA